MDEEGDSTQEDGLHFSLSYINDLINLKFAPDDFTLTAAKGINVTHHKKY